MYLCTINNKIKHIIDNMALNAKATQEFVPIKQVRDGIIVLKDGDMRAIVLANSVNLSLKSSDEQKATIMQFQNFLNTLDCI